MYKKLATGVITTSLLVGNVATPTTSAEENEQVNNNNDVNTEETQKSNEENNTDNQDKSKDEQEKLKNKVYVEGADLNESQSKETKDELGVSNGYEKYKITTDDVSRYTGGTYDFIHSSATIAPKRLGKGIDVDIATPDNISKITKEQYINASITSGIENAKIKVASIDEVSGEGALTGIYKGLEEEGIDVNQEDVQNANQEMEDLSDIKQEQDNDGNNDYSDKVMNNAVAEMKEKVAKEKIDGKDVSRDDVEKIVDITLKAKHLDKVVTDNQKQKLVTIVYNTSQSEAMKKDPKSVATQSKDLKDNLSDSVKDFNKNSDGFLTKLWNGFISFIQAIGNIFIQLFEKIGKLFS